MSLSIRQERAAAIGPAPIARPALLAALTAGLVAGFVAGHAGALPSEDVDLARLLRAMAALKLLFVAAASAAMLWRMQAPIRPVPLALYALSAFAMAAGPGLIWTLAHVALGAALLHLGLFASVLLLWRDEAVGRLLAAAIARRRARA